jgi:hypothetical protein
MITFSDYLGIIILLPVFIFVSLSGLWAILRIFEYQIWK